MPTLFPDPPAPDALAAVLRAWPALPGGGVWVTAAGRGWFVTLTSGDRVVHAGPYAGRQGHALYALVPAGASLDATARAAVARWVHLFGDA